MVKEREGEGAVQKNWLTHQAHNLKTTGPTRIVKEEERVEKLVDSSDS